VERLAPSRHHLPSYDTLSIHRFRRAAAREVVEHPSDSLETLACCPRSLSQSLDSDCSVQYWQGAESLNFCRC
jgi:hypothetical protein